ncbi:hypothetical protein [Amycolatopsis sp. cg9]|uniref:hypothetical protein n=1 Tax=Amycolatopsis sp. cg9 TaxID=3238801 RepID=UPI003526618B
MWFALPAAGGVAWRLRGPVRNRAAASEDGFGGWLPLPTDHDRRIGFAAETGRLRRVAGRAAAFVLVWMALARAGAAALVLLDEAADELLATGARTAKIVRDSKNSNFVGERVIVVHDRPRPRPPDRVRTLVEENKSRFLVNLGYVLLVAGSLGTLFAVLAAVGWWGRARAVAATGWRNATVDVVRVSAGNGRSLRRAPPEIHVRYREGTGIVLKAERPAPPRSVRGSGFRVDPAHRGRGPPVTGGWRTRRRLGRPG